MGSNFAQTEKNVLEIEKKLDSILDSAESQHPFSKKNFVFMKKLVFLWIVGEQDEEMKKFLETEIQQIVEDERTVRIIQSRAEKLKGESVYTEIYNGIDCAARNYLSVDMDHMIICPIFLPGCFEKEGSCGEFTQACLYMQQEMGKRHRYPEWNPYVLLQDEKIDMTKRQIQSVLQFMNMILDDGRKNFRDCCSPGCVISDRNELGQEISVEQKAKIIVMLAAFRNTNCENENTLSTVMLPISKSEQEYFFTARAISICEPVKSLTLNRLLAVHHYFLDGRFTQDKPFENWKHSFFEGSVWKEQLDKVAHDEKYAILTAPIYSNIPLPDLRQYEQSLRKFCSKYYFEPLSDKVGKLMEEWWKSFWEEFFLQTACSIRNLDDLEENRDKIIERVPPANVRRAESPLASDMRKGCEDWLVSELKRQPRYLVERAMQPEGKYIRRFRMKKEFLKESLYKVQNSIQNQERRLRQTEILLNTGGGHVADPRDEAEHWLQDYINNEPRKVTNIYQVYQSMLCEFFCKDSYLLDELNGYLLDIYNKIVSGSIESREAYMKTKLANLAGSDMGQLIQKLGESWLYPVRLIGSTDQNKAQRLYVMGNKENYLCRKMLEQTNYQVAFKESTLDDRLEIVRVSDRFTEQQIYSDTQEG